MTSLAISYKNGNQIRRDAHAMRDEEE
jgi:hypothetical protein